MNTNLEAFLNGLHKQSLKTGDALKIGKDSLPTYKPYTSKTQPLESLKNLFAVPTTFISIAAFAATLSVGTLLLSVALVATAPASFTAATVGRAVLSIQEGKNEGHSNTKQALNMGKNAVYGGVLILGGIIGTAIISAIVSALSAVLAAASLLLAATAGFAYGAEMIVRTAATGGKAAMSFFKSTAAKDNLPASNSSDPKNASSDDEDYSSSDDEDFEMDSKGFQFA